MIIYAGLIKRFQYPDKTSTRIMIDYWGHFLFGFMCIIMAMILEINKEDDGSRKEKNGKTPKAARKVSRKSNASDKD